ncbi:putative disease resistance RPP13-like protein 1 [Cannabis sativa]|uniref:putative disease resistance RPP13-like protein 1 n=1 Tax=Cannabis sativa TaxID=3483 RepID=UPI0029C9C3B6|nr:putative disease resistance RPP13-like protein 1 [Cannabis sativa]
MAELAVGGAFLSAFLQVLFDRLASKEVVDFFHGKKHIVDLLNELNLTLLSATSLLNDAEEKQLQDQTVRTWLNDFKEVVHEADEVVDEINTEALRRSLEVESDIDNIMSKMFLKFIPTTSFWEFDNPVKTKIVGILEFCKGYLLLWQ